MTAGVVVQTGNNGFLLNIQKAVGQVDSANNIQQLITTTQNDLVDIDFNFEGLNYSTVVGATGATGFSPNGTTSNPTLNGQAGAQGVVGGMAVSLPLESLSIDTLAGADQLSLTFQSQGGQGGTGGRGGLGGQQIFTGNTAAVGGTGGQGGQGGKGGDALLVVDGGANLLRYNTGEGNDRMNVDLIARGGQGGVGGQGGQGGQGYAVNPDMNNAPGKGGQGGIGGQGGDSGNATIFAANLAMNAGAGDDTVHFGVVADTNAVGLAGQGGVGGFGGGVNALNGANGVMGSAGGQGLTTITLNNIQIDGGQGLDRVDVDVNGSDLRWSIQQDQATVARLNTLDDIRLTNVEQFVSGKGNDIFKLKMISALGNYSYDGGLGQNTLDLSGFAATDSLRVDTGTQSFALASNSLRQDHFENFAKMILGAGHDQVVAGNHSLNIDGGAGVNNVDYQASTTPVVVSLNSVLSGGIEVLHDQNQRDVLQNIQQIQLSQNADLINVDASTVITNLNVQAGLGDDRWWIISVMVLLILIKLFLI